MKQRHFPFFPEHWKGDVTLRMCSSGARGLWIDMMCEMHSAEPYGHLATPTGVPIATPEQLARVVGESANDVKRWLGELESVEVFSRTESGVIYSRRMVRDQKARDEWNERKRKERDNRVTCTNCHAIVTDESREFHGLVPGVSHQCLTYKGKGKKGKRERSVPDGTAPPENSEAFSRPVLPDSLPGSWPSDVLSLRSVARCFLEAFGNCTTPEARKKYGPDYLDALAIFRSRGSSIAETWDAFTDARIAQDGKPLFGASAKKAVAYLQARDSRQSGEKPAAKFGSLRPEDRDGGQSA